MALETLIDNLEGVEEKYQDLYVKNSDGKFEINIDGLKSTLAKERVARKKLEKQISTKQDPDLDSVELQNQLKEAKSTINTMKITSKLKNIAITAGIDAEYVDDVITLTKGNFGLNEEGAVVIVDADGEPTEKSVENFFSNDFKKKKPRFYIGTGRTGGGSQPNLDGDLPLSHEGKIKKALAEKNLAALIHLKHNKK